jgi:hypothetical protein
MEVIATDAPVGLLRWMTPVPEVGAPTPRRLCLAAGAIQALDAVAAGG